MSKKKFLVIDPKENGLSNLKKLLVYSGVEEEIVEAANVTNLKAIVEESNGNNTSITLEFPKEGKWTNVTPRQCKYKRVIPGVGSKDFKAAIDITYPFTQELLAARIKELKVVANEVEYFNDEEGNTPFSIDLDQELPAYFYMRAKPNSYIYQGTTKIEGVVVLGLKEFAKIESPFIPATQPVGEDKQKTTLGSFGITPLTPYKEDPFGLTLSFSPENFSYFDSTSFYLSRTNSTGGSIEASLVPVKEVFNLGETSKDHNSLITDMFNISLAKVKEGDKIWEPGKFSLTKILPKSEMTEEVLNIDDGYPTLVGYAEYSYAGSEKAKIDTNNYPEGIWVETRPFEGRMQFGFPHIGEVFKKVDYIQGTVRSLQQGDKESQDLYESLDHSAWWAQPPVRFVSTTDPIEVDITKDQIDLFLERFFTGAGISKDHLTVTPSDDEENIVTISVNEDVSGAYGELKLKLTGEARVPV